MKRLTFAATRLLAGCLYMAAPFAQADFDAGLKAYNELYAYQRAYREFLVEGARGHREAQFYLGEICEGGVGRPIDYHEAFRWYQDSAWQGYGPAQQRLARLYRNGRGVGKNLQMAFIWQKKLPSKARWSLNTVWGTTILRVSVPAESPYLPINGGPLPLPGEIRTPCRILKSFPKPCPGTVSGRPWF